MVHACVPWLVDSSSMAACFVEYVEGLGRCLMAGRDIEPGEEILMEAPLLAADAAEADLAYADMAIEAEEGQPWSRVKVDATAVSRLLGLLQAYARSEPDVKRAILELDDTMEAGTAAFLVRKLAALLSESSFCPRMRKMELHCVLCPICPHAICHVPMLDVGSRHCCVVSLGLVAKSKVTSLARKIFWTNAFPFGNGGSALFRTLCYCAHSCHPNAFFYHCSNSGHVVSLKAISRGSRVEISYVPRQPLVCIVEGMSV